MNNAVFGKTMENVLKRRNIKLFDCWENQSTGKRGAISFAGSGYLKKVTIFNHNFMAAELEQKHVKLDKAIQVGFTILEIAKTRMYDFHYNFMKQLYPEPDQAKICYTDTDSLVYQVFTEDYYADLHPFVHNPKRNIELFDTSDYPVDNIYGYAQVNKKVLGAMKDECNGKIMHQFIGLRAKCYSYLMLGDNDWKNKAKGVKRCVADKLQPTEYEACLEDRDKVVCKVQRVFRSRLHQLYTEELKKCALNGADDKRYIRSDGINTYAWGHYMIEAENLTDEQVENLELMICDM
jgi:nicotinamide riboside kinase